MTKGLISSLLLLMITIFSSKAQIIFECNSRTYCNYELLGNKYYDCITEEDASYFELNEAGTEIVHYAENITSIYFIESRHYESYNDVMILKVRSDADYKYEFYINIEKKELKAFFESSEYKGLVAIFSLKDIYEK